MVLERSRLTILAALCVAASVVLAVVPFVSPRTPIGPFLFVNWLAFILVVFLGRQKRVSLWVFVAFALAGWLSILTAKVII